MTVRLALLNLPPWVEGPDVLEFSSMSVPSSSVVARLLELSELSSLFCDVELDSLFDPWLLILGRNGGSFS